jgi:hypothetical protein
VGSNPAEGIDVWCVYSVSVLPCIWVGALRRAEHSSQRVLPSVKNDYGTE